MAEEGLRGRAIQCIGNASHRGVCLKAARTEKHSKGHVYMCVVTASTELCCSVHGLCLLILY